MVPLITKPLVIIGNTGVGKTSVAEALSVMREIPIVDTDNVFENIHGQTINQFFDKHKEEDFRRGEATSIDQTFRAYTGQRVIIPIGAGAPAHKYSEIRERNIHLLRKGGYVVYLLVSPDHKIAADIIYQRFLDNPGELAKRPLLNNNTSNPHEKLLQMLKERHPFYERAMHERLVIGNMSLDQVANQLGKLYCGLNVNANSVQLV